VVTVTTYSDAILETVRFMELYEPQIVQYNASCCLEGMCESGFKIRIVMKKRPPTQVFPDHCGEIPILVDDT
jgi:hypothetical protein